MLATWPTFHEATKQGKWVIPPPRPRVVRVRRQTAINDRVTHKWWWLHSRQTYFCHWCGLLSNEPAPTKCPRSLQCSSWLSEVHPTHALATIVGRSLSLIFCRTCGYYGEQHIKFLDVPCGGRALAHRPRLARLLKGNTPQYREIYRRSAQYSC